MAKEGRRARRQRASLSELRAGTFMSSWDLRLLWEAGKWGSVSPAVKQRVLGESSVDLCSVLC